ncbi:MAG: N-methyl-D-aspartate receptor NMDAR2C subunit [Pantanalinema sp. GBBB05]|nr:N-methyl-D-aspartate receptor NMDAR2C subunit [Pantanalinema sp. GBBB05]
MQLLQQSWQRTWLMLAVQPEADLFDRLIVCYREPHRHYHTLQHLHECIEKLESVLAIAEHPGEVEVALWFHDAVYALQRQDNELQSAVWAKQAVLAGGGSAEVAERILALVLATRHSALPRSLDEGLVMDVDLSILGASPERFEEYERQIRQEYAWVADELFRCKRQAILGELLDRTSIFSTEPFRSQLEVQARENLQRSIARLSG